jgi:glycosyltransferase involved in cell wall biosynthesis
MQKLNRPLRILLIGPLPPPVGGTTVMFQQLVEELSGRMDVEIVVVDSSRKTYNYDTLLSYISTAIRVVGGIVRAIRKVDVVTFHASTAGALLFSPFIHIVSRLFKKPWILRKFGGNFDQYYQQLAGCLKTIARYTALSADLCAFETQHLVNFFRNRCKHKVVWYPNSRPITDETLSNRRSTCCKRFVFVGDVKPTKGVREIITAGEQLSTEVVVDIYGPLLGGITEQDFKELKIVRYRGMLEPKQVIPTLQTYDVLLLPTYYSGEGYPGVILEAYSAGLPVITTKWRAIPEIVDEISGILIEPKDSEQLLVAMKKLISDKQLHQTLYRGVLEKRKQFSVEEWTNKFVHFCKFLAKIS